jgi:isopenicillin N synthase-like dioxygenase
MNKTAVEESTMHAGGHLPVIDLSPMRGQDPAAKRALASEIDSAFRSVGFCYITGHGIPDQVIDHAFAVAERFFNLPTDLKSSVSVNESFMGYTGPELRNQFHVNYSTDGTLSMQGNYNATRKESYVTMYDPADPADHAAMGSAAASRNVWPAFLPEFQQGLSAYFAAFRRVGDSIMQSIAIALKLPEDFFVERFRDPLSLCIANYYPALSSDNVRAGMVSLPAHSDYSCITMVLQDDVGGLEVLERDTQRWVAAPPLKGSLVLNVGDLLARWSNDRYVSTPHRVMNRSGSGRARLSLPVTHNPGASIVVDPRDLGVTEADCRYPPVECGEYQRIRFEEIYAPQVGVSSSTR